MVILGTQQFVADFMGEFIQFFTGFFTQTFPFPTPSGFVNISLLLFILIATFGGVLFHFISGLAGIGLDKFNEKRGGK